MKFKTLLSVSALSIATFIGSAQAAIIPAMDFATQSGWLADGVNSSSKQANGTVFDCAAGTTDAANGCGLTFTGAAGLPNAYDTVTWGSSNAKSGLNIVSQAGTLVTNGDWVQTGLITHSNKTILAGSRSLYKLDLETLFTLVNPPAGSKAATVGIQFNETPNTSNPANCPIPQLSGTGCDDTFLIKLNLPAIKFVVAGPEGKEQYTISFKLNPLSGVTQSVVNPDGSIVLVTTEGTVNQLELLAQLTMSKVSAPATVGMLGLSLIMLGLRRRNKQ